MIVEREPYFAGEKAVTINSYIYAVAVQVLVLITLMFERRWSLNDYQADYEYLGVSSS